MLLRSQWWNENVVTALNDIELMICIELQGQKIKWMNNDVAIRIVT